MMFIPWPDIQSFHNVRKSAEKYPEILGGRCTVDYRPKIKLHGTNAAIQIRGDKVIAQSRTQIIGTGNDNCGFAAWAESNAEAFISRSLPRILPCIIFGEWCGPGIMKGVAINKIPEKIFAVFAAAFLPVEDNSILITEPEDLFRLVQGIPNTCVLPWYGKKINSIPIIGQSDYVQSFLDDINSDVKIVEEMDPWVKEVFGIEGVGEGLVYYPLGANRKDFSNLCFKAKGEKHKVVAKNAPAQIDPSVAASIDEFVAMVLTEARLEQGARAVACGELNFAKKLLGPFLAWICQDVQKETVAELEGSNLTWKQVQKFVSDTARQWYLNKESRV
jgi:hypothetical protein